jgi:hypothetical protein
MKGNSMVKINVFKFQSAINLYAITDAHIGSKAHDAVKFKKTIAQIKKDPIGYCFFNGDNIEFIPPDYGISEEGQEECVNEQIEIFVQLLNDLGPKCLFFRSGNHESRAYARAGVNLARHISREVDIPYLNVGMEEVHIYIKKKKYRIVTSHGEGGGSKRVLDNMEKTFPAADLYFSGHTHERYYNDSTMNIDTSSGDEEFRSQIKMVGGSYLGWADYARAKNMVPQQSGSFILRLDEESIRVKGVIK